MKVVLERILNGENPRLVFLEDKYSSKSRFPVKIKKYDISNITPEQLSKLRENGERAFKWMKEFVKGSGLDSCDIILETPRDRMYIEISPETVAFSPNLYNYTVSDFIDDETLASVVFNWPVIKEKVKRACDWLIRNKKEKEKSPESIGNKITNFAI